MTESWSWVANRHTLRSGDQACNLNSTVALRASPLPSLSAECTFLLQHAGLNGEKPVTATFTGGSPTSTQGNGNNGSGNTTNKNGSLSAGAKAGIALGALAIVGAVLVAILVLLRRRKNQLKRNAPVEAGPGTPSGAVFYKYNISEAPGSIPYKGSSQGTPELQSSWMPPMVAAHRDPVELAAGSRNHSTTQLVHDETFAHKYGGAGDAADQASGSPTELQTGTTNTYSPQEKANLKK